jgi:hypothetical protein
MAQQARRRPTTGLLTLVVGSGLAALIAGLSSYANQRAQIDQDAEAARCSLAASILQDETLSPYLSEAERGKLVARAAVRAERCMKDQE